MIDLYCITHKKLTCHHDALQIIGVGGVSGDGFNYLDSEGENISHLNECFSELTGHYFVWKNLLADSNAVGFCHYRRFLVPSAAKQWLLSSSSQSFDNRASGGEGNYASGYLLETGLEQELLGTPSYLSELQSDLKNVDILLPKRNLLTEDSFLGQYSRCHPSKPFFMMLTEIAKMDTELANRAFYFYTHTHYAYWNNLFITKSETFNQYCNFLFDILIPLEKVLEKYPQQYQNRVCAFLSERLLNFWVFENNLLIKEIDWCVTSEILDEPADHQIAIPGLEET